MVDDPASRHFRCDDRERAAFEAGIKLGAVLHQFAGAPVSAANAAAVERAMEECLKVQPFVEAVAVKIDAERLRDKRHEYDYVSLTGDMLDVRLRVRYGDARAEAALEFVEDLSYPLMHLRMLD